MMCKPADMHVQHPAQAVHYAAGDSIRGKMAWFDDHRPLKSHSSTADPFALVTLDNGQQHGETVQGIFAYSLWCEAYASCRHCICKDLHVGCERALSCARLGCFSTSHTYSSLSSVCVTTMCGCMGTSRILFTCCSGGVLLITRAFMVMTAP